MRVMNVSDYYRCWLLRLRYHLFINRFFVLVFVVLEMLFIFLDNKLSIRENCFFLKEIDLFLVIFLKTLVTLCWFLVFY